MTSQVQRFGRISGISRIGDLLRQYASNWLAYYIAEGSPADHVRDLDMHGPVSAVGGFVFFFNFSLRL